MDDFTTRMAAFQQRWVDHIKADRFEGSADDYRSYQKEAYDLDGERLSLDMEYQNLKAKGERLAREQAKELEKYVKVGANDYILKDEYAKLDPKYQSILRTQGFDALNRRISGDNKKIMHDALMQNFDPFLDDNAHYDLVKAYKSGIGERTIALAFGEDKARAAVKVAGPPPPGGWGPKAPSMPKALGIVTAETLFPASRQWLEPELHYKATGMDWAVGAAQIALFAVPFAGGLLGRAAVAAETAGRGLRPRGWPWRAAPCQLPSRRALRWSSRRTPSTTGNT